MMALTARLFFTISSSVVSIKDLDIVVNYQNQKNEEEICFFFSSGEKKEKTSIINPSPSVTSCWLVKNFKISRFKCYHFGTSGNIAVRDFFFFLIFNAIIFSLSFLMNEILPLWNFTTKTSMVRKKIFLSEVF